MVQVNEMRITTLQRTP